jgi:hypothetical protein
MMADDDSSKQQQRWTMTVREIGRWTMKGKEERGRQTVEKLKTRFPKTTSVFWYGLSGWSFCPTKTPYLTF